MSDVTFFYPLEFKQGADVTHTFQWAIDGVPVDLTGASARAQLRRTAAAGAILAELSTANGDITIDGPTGTITLKIPASVTAALSGSGEWDLELTFANGDVVYLVEGPFTVHPRVTR